MGLRLDAHLVVWFRLKQPCNLEIPHGWSTNSLYNLQYMNSNTELHTLTNTQCMSVIIASRSDKQSEGILQLTDQKLHSCSFSSLSLSFFSFLLISLSSLRVSFTWYSCSVLQQYLPYLSLCLFCAPSLHPHITPPLCLHSPLHIWRAQGPQSVRSRSTTSICVCVQLYSEEHWLARAE